MIMTHLLNDSLHQAKYKAQTKGFGNRLQLGHCTAHLLSPQQVRNNMLSTTVTRQQEMQL